MHGLIDGDILVYRIGYSTEDVPERLAAFRLRDYFNEILESLMLSDYQTFITSADKSNYRFAIDNSYKANRKQPKPVHYDFLRSCILESYSSLFRSSMSVGKEADDSIGIIASQSPTKYCIITVDKDLNQIPGWHYNFVKKKKYYVSKLGGTKFFYKQLLMGDSADNIQGIIGIGPKLADELIDPLENELDMYKTVYQIYKDVDDIANITKRGQLLKIQTKPNELWLPPEVSSEELENPVEIVTKVNWKKSFERFSKIQQKRLSMNQSECISNIQPPSDSTCPIG